MTTNAGAQDMARAAIGFGSAVRDADDNEAITRMFTPEFRNRLDAIIAFSHLPPEIVRKVVEKFVLQLEAQLSERQINIELSAEAADWLARKGYDQADGRKAPGAGHPGTHQAAGGSSLQQAHKVEPCAFS
jgi:ATP-dependent Clp protease ATP-binding subunit ClpA